MTAGPRRGWRAAATSGLHVDLEYMIKMLKAAFLQDLSSKHRFDVRLSQVFASPFHPELAAPTADIPAGLIGAQALEKPSGAQVRPPMNKRHALRPYYVGDTHFLLKMGRIMS